MGEGAGGLFDSLKALAATLIAMAHTRLELLATELEEERQRLASLLGLMLAALFCLGLGIALLTTLIVALYWDGYRLQVLAGLAGLFLAAGATAWRLALRRLRCKPRLFAASLAELDKDRQPLAP